MTFTTNAIEISVKKSYKSNTHNNNVMIQSEKIALMPATIENTIDHCTRQNKTKDMVIISKI